MDVADFFLGSCVRKLKDSVFLVIFLQSFPAYGWK